MNKKYDESIQLDWSEDEKGNIFVTGGDLEFQKELTQIEKDYIQQGCNWISKLAREQKLKELHNQGLTLDEYLKNNKAEN